MSIFNPVQSFVDMTKSWQQSMKDKANKANTNQMMANAQGMFQAWLSSNDQTVKNNYMSGSNLNTIAWAIVTYAEWKWKYEDYANLQPSEVVDLFLQRNKWRGYEEYINQYTGWKIWLEQATKLIGINQNEVNPYVFSEDVEDADFDPSLLTNFEFDDDFEDWWEDVASDKKKNNLVTWWVGWASLLWADVWLHYLWKAAQPAWRKLYNTTFTPSIKEASLVSNRWWKIYEAERALKDAEKALAEAKSTGVWVEDAEKNLNIAKKKLNWLKNKEITTTAESAWNSWLGSNLKMWWLPWWELGRASEAKWLASEIFSKYINKYLDSSTEVVNVQEIINNLQNEVNKLAWVHPWKQQAYGEALDTLREMFADEMFANLPVKDVQNLKKQIWSTTPQKYFKGKELSNEFSELEGMLGTKLRDALHKSLTKTAWEDTAKMYLNYANLMDYASTQDKLATKKFTLSKLKDMLAEPATQKWGRILNSAGKALEENTMWGWIKKLANSVNKAWNYIAENGKKFLKSTKWGLKVEDPVGIVELLQLVPWTIWDLADMAAENPAVTVDNLLFEVQSYKDAWNKMSDEERIQQIQAEYKDATWEDLDDNSAKASYERWKKTHKGGKYGLMDAVNDIEIVKQA